MMQKNFQHFANTVDVSILQNKIDRFTEWTDKWLVKLNVSKCKIMSVCRKGSNQNQIKSKYLLTAAKKKKKKKYHC